MIDLSNNNGTRHNFRTIFASGQRRIYLKIAEGTNFKDPTYASMRRRALEARLKVGAYDFLHPLEATPDEAADFLLARLPNPLVPGRDLRPALDCEWPSVKPNAKVGQWYAACAKRVWRTLGFKPLIYGNGYYLEDCQFRTQPGPLWLAAYGKDTGREYPVGRLPAPWGKMAAHQFTDRARVVGVDGQCDLSRVYAAALIELPPNL